MARIVIHRFGDVKEGFVEEVLEIVNDCYDRLGAHDVEIVDLCIFDRSSLMNAFVSEEKRRLGIGTSAFEGSFFALHDAWRGTPRIMVACDKMSTLPRLVGVGGLRHEVAHTVLHGSLEYYSFPMPASLLKLGDEGIMTRQVMGDLLYLAAIAVKDFEVTRLLREKGCLEDQVAYVKHFLEPSEDEREAWKLSENNRTARLLVLVSLLKTPTCAASLLKDERYREEIAENIAGSVSFLPTGLSARVLNILKVASKFGEDTHENVDLLMKKIIDELVVEERYLDTREN